MLVQNGHRLSDIKNNYSIAQVYLYFEKAKKLAMEKDRMNAIVFANCLMGTSESSNASEARKKNLAFSQFMDSLSWDMFVTKAEEKQQPKTAKTTMKQLFGGVGLVPFRNREK